MKIKDLSSFPQKLLIQNSAFIIHHSIKLLPADFRKLPHRYL
jgi:hypothetical protein